LASGDGPACGGSGIAKRFVTRVRPRLMRAGEERFSGWPPRDGASDIEIKNRQTTSGT